MDNEIVLHHRAGRSRGRRRRRRGRSSVAADAWLAPRARVGDRALNEEFLAEHGLEPQTLTLGSNGAIKQAARAGLGVSLLSRAAVETELEAGWLGEIRLSRRPGAAALVRAPLGGRPDAPAVEQFTDFVAKRRRRSARRGCGAGAAAAPIAADRDRGARRDEW